MKTIISWTFIVVAAVTSVGCFTYEKRTPVVVTSTAPAPVVREETVTVLPSGYRTRTYRGSTYYYTTDRVYTSRPSGGYVVVPSPW